MSLQQALQARDEGIERVAANNQEFLKIARAEARRLCHEQGDVTANDVRKVIKIHPVSQNAWGAVFRSSEFITNGDMRMSTHRSRHGGLNRVWKLKSQLGV